MRPPTLEPWGNGDTSLYRVSCLSRIARDPARVHEIPFCLQKLASASRFARTDSQVVAKTISKQQLQTRTRIARLPPECSGALKGAGAAQGIVFLRFQAPGGGLAARAADVLPSTLGFSPATRLVTGAAAPCYNLDYRSAGVRPPAAREQTTCHRSRTAASVTFSFSSPSNHPSSSLRQEEPITAKL